MWLVALVLALNWLCNFAMNLQAASFSLNKMAVLTFNASNRQDVKACICRFLFIPFLVKLNRDHPSHHGRKNISMKLICTRRFECILRRAGVGGWGRAGSRRCRFAHLWTWQQVNEVKIWIWPLFSPWPNYFIHLMMNLQIDKSMEDENYRFLVFFSWAR